MEERITIPTEDNTSIYVTHKGNWSWPTIIFVHGLTSSPLESKYYNGARFFEKKNIATVRFPLYSWESDARKLYTCTMDQHGTDIDTISTYIKKQGAPYVILIGHSMGALCALHAHQSSYDHIVFWDGSYRLEKWLTGEHVASHDSILLDCGFHALLAQSMIQDIAATDYVKKVQELEHPLSLIYAGDGVILDGMHAYDRAARRSDTYIVEGAGHNFEEDETEKDLLEATYRSIATYYGKK